MRNSASFLKVSLWYLFIFESNILMHIKIWTKGSAESSHSTPVVGSGMEKGSVWQQLHLLWGGGADSNLH